MILAMHAIAPGSSDMLKRELQRQAGVVFVGVQPSGCPWLLLHLNPAHLP